MALLVALIVIQIVLLTYTIIDSATGATRQKIMDAFNAWLDKCFPGNDAAKAGIKALFGAILIVVLIIAIVFTGGGAAASIASATATQTAVAVVKEIVKQLSYQLILMVIMTSNAIPELFGAMLKACGVQDTKIGEMIMMIITMIIAIAATAKGGGAGGLGKGVAGAAETGADAAAKAAADAAKQATKNFQEIMAAAIQKLKDLPKNLADGIKKGLTEAIEGLKSIKDGFADLKKVLGGLSQMSDAKKVIKDAASDVATIAQKTEELAQLKEAVTVAGRNVAESTTKSLKISAAVIETGQGIANGVIGIQIYKLKVQVGDLQEADALLQSIIDLLQKLLDNMDLGIQSSADLLTSANNFLSKFTAGWEESDKKIFGSRSM